MSDRGAPPRHLLRCALSFAAVTTFALTTACAGNDNGYRGPTLASPGAIETVTEGGCAAGSDAAFRDVQGDVLFDVYCPASLPQGLELRGMMIHDVTGEGVPRIIEARFADEAGLQVTLRQGALPSETLLLLTPDVGETLRSPAMYGPLAAVVTAGRLVASAPDGAYHEIVADGLPLEVLRRIGLEMRPLPPPGDGEG